MHDGKFSHSILGGKLFFLFASASENEVIIIWRRVVTTNWEIMLILEMCDQIATN